MPDHRRWLVVAVTALLLTATVLPAAAVGGKPGAEATGDSTVDRPVRPDDVGQDASAVDRKRAAVAIVASLDDGRGRRTHRHERTLDLLNDTLTDYRDGYRVSSPSVFHDDRRAVESLSRFAWRDARADEAADLVVAADLATVNTSIADARLALDRFGGRVDGPRTRRRAERAVARAIRARNRSLNAPRRRHRTAGWGWMRGTRGSVRRADSITHLATAWSHAQRAMDLLDRASVPVVTIETRSDPPRNGSEAVTRTIRGNVSSVRAYELGNVSVTVDDSGQRRAPLDASTAPARNASFAVNVTLEDPITEVSVSTSATSGRPSGRQGGGGPGWRGGPDQGDVPPRNGAGHRSRAGTGRDGRFAKGADDRRVGAAVVRFDGDGLPDRYEIAVLGSDPLNPDSDSTRTDDNEADDGVLDGGEDFDGDRLVTYAEYDLGTDPFDSDTDDDGLPDRFEASGIVVTDATNGDTDGDGIVDGAEDFDGDGLEAAAELGNGTSVAATDTDHDGLGDAVEVLVYGTSPVDADTDGDGLDDGVERRLATDPLVVDSSGDGIADGNETYRTTTRDDETGVTVSLSGAGDVASQVSVENVSQPAGSDFLRGPVVHVHNRTAFERATVTIPIDDAVSLTDSANLSVYKWSPDDDRPWHAVNSTVDDENRTASTNVSSFSFFTVMNENEWRAKTTDTVSPSWPRFDGFTDLAGWNVTGSAEVYNASLVVSGDRGVDAVVAKDGSGDYDRIQPAVDAASEGSTILVEAGTYRETLTLDASVQLVGDGARLDGTGLGEETAGVQLENGTAVSLSGFSIQHFGTGLQATATSTDVRLRGTTFRDDGVGVDARGTSGNWSIHDVAVLGSEVDGIDARDSTGRWTISKADLSHSGNAGLRALRSGGDFGLSDVRASDDGFLGIDAALSTGDWTISRLETSGDGWGGIGAGSAQGDWTVRGYRASNNVGGGVTAVSTTGDWTVSEVLLRGNRRGITTTGASGDWLVNRSSITDNADTGVDARQADGSTTVTESRIFDNGGTGIDGRGASGPIDASENWWGRASGAAPGQTRGAVYTGQPCEAARCAPIETSENVPELEDVGVRGGNGSRGGTSRQTSTAERALTIPTDTKQATVSARLRGTGSSTSLASLSVTDGGAETTVAKITSTDTSFRIESANVSAYAGETITLEVTAESDAQIVVDWVDVAYDTDGDGLTDVVENASLGMPVGPRPGASLDALDPRNPDSDGDGTPDGQELTGVRMRARSSGKRETLSIRALDAVSDPTSRNSDGGGLNDSEERAIGSDPFVLESLVTGYVIPTMTEGPGDTLADRNPMTVREASGVQTSGGPDSDLIGWPARQFYNPLFCIKELTPGPGCAPAWMIGIKQQEDKHYVYIPFVVYAESNVDTGPLEYQMSFNSDYSATFVKGVNVSGTISPGESRSGYLVYELPNMKAYEESQPRVFRSVGQVNYNPDLSNTIFSRKGQTSVGRGYSVSTSTLLPATEDMLEDTQFVLEKGINVALAAETGATVTVKTGSRARGALVFLYELAKSQVDTPPTSLEDIATSVSVKGIGSFQEKIQSTEDKIHEDIYGDGVVRPVGPTIIREN